MKIHLKRVYEPASTSDGFRVLVDRLWPRGLSKEVARVDLWAKDVAPSKELRTAWHHDPDWREGQGFAGFRRAYEQELATEPAKSALEALIEAITGKRTVTLLYGAKTDTETHATILKDLIEQ